VALRARWSEHCCDDLAVAVQGDALAYARALAELEPDASGRSSRWLRMVARYRHASSGYSPFYSMKAQPGPWLTD
jgi:hypothetical protein